MKVKNIKTKFSSITFKLFSILVISTILIVTLIVLVNSVALKYIYQYTKTQTAQKLYSELNSYYSSIDANNENIQNVALQEKLRQLEIKYSVDFNIVNEDNVEVYSSRKDIANNENVDREKRNNDFKSLFGSSNEKFVITENESKSDDTNYMTLTGKLDNGYTVFIKVSLFPVQESVRLSNQTLILIGLIIIVVSLIVSIFLSRNITYPIVRMTGITNKITRLDFSEKYRISDSNDEINTLGRNINMMSDKLEKTINELKKNNNELERDIQEKTKIDEMRKQFISDVSHELKTPIALIQGYAEGLLENVTSDEEAKQHYAEVILDESNRMDKLVKQLLQLMKLEYGKMKFKEESFDICELIEEVIRRCQMMSDEKKVTVSFRKKDAFIVKADAYYIEQVFTNYLTNAIKHVKEINGEKLIKITIKMNKETQKVRVSVFNTGDQIAEENLEKIWGRFYKIDESRNREDGGTGIGLALVKAIMTNYQEKYGVKNKQNGVEFYFECQQAE